MTKKKKDGKVRDINIRLAFIKRNIKFFEQENIEFCNEYGINSTNIVDFAGFDFKNNIFYKRHWDIYCPRALISVWEDNSKITEPRPQIVISSLEDMSKVPDVSIENVCILEYGIEV